MENIENQELYLPRNLIMKIPIQIQLKQKQENELKCLICGEEECDNKYKIPLDTLNIFDGFPCIPKIARFPRKKLK